MESPREAGAIRDLYGDGSRQHNTKPESAPQYRVVCKDFRAFSKNTLQGFATLGVEPPSLAMQGCSVHEKNGKRWVNFPAKQYTGEDGIARWQALVSIESKGSYWEFQSLALAAIDEHLGQAGIEICGEGGVNGPSF